MLNTDSSPASHAQGALLAADLVRSVLPLSLIGALLALAALLLMQWQMPGEVPAYTGLHTARIVQRFQQGDVIGALSDLLMYGVTGGALVFSLLAWRSGGILPLTGAFGSALLGLLYVAPMAQYNGAMVGVYAFCLIASASGIGLAASFAARDFIEAEAKTAALGVASNLSENISEHEPTIIRESALPTQHMSDEAPIAAENNQRSEIGIEGTEDGAAIHHSA